MSELQKSLPMNRSGSWMSLPAELRIMILKHVDESDAPDDPCREPPPRLAACAAVSREWQMHFEAVTFRHLELHQDDLDKLAEYLPARSYRVDMLRSVHLRLVLDEYNCRFCGSREEPWEASANNVILTEALWKLFNGMAAWGNPRSRPLELELSAHSPSDWEHAYKPLRFRARDRHRGGHNRHEAAERSEVDDDPGHFWSDGLRNRAPGTSAWRRVQGSGLRIDNQCSAVKNQPTLPPVHMVGALVIRRQFYRRFGVYSCLSRMIKALPNLFSFCYEPWRASRASPHDVERQMRHYLFLVRIISQYPNIRKVSIFEDFNDLNGFVRLPATAPRQKDPSMSALLAKTSRPWEWASFSFMADAADFFHEFWPKAEAQNSVTESPARWENLTRLCLTSDLLHPSGDVGGLLGAAARAAMLMPKLERLTLWNAGRGHGGFFQYSIGRNGRPEIWMGSTWGARLDPQTAELWTRVACQWQPRYPLVKFFLKLREGDMGSHGSILWMLRDPFVATRRSQEQLLSEGLAKSKFAATHPEAIVARSISLVQGTLVFKISTLKGVGPELAYEFLPRARKSENSEPARSQIAE
ncbi:hypothetical protein PG995_011375 [Apiospora arundinis]